MYDLIIIGSGPGGLTAALYASRANLKVGIVTGDMMGGQLMNTELIENYPGYKSIEGYMLASEMQEHATEFGAELIFDTVASLTKDDVFKVKLSEATLDAKAVIVASGSSHKTLGLSRESELTGSGVSYCAICDGAFAKNKIVSVIGGGDSAFEEALYLTKYSNDVHIFVRNKVRAKKELQDRVAKNNSITVHMNTPIESISGDNQVESISLSGDKGSFSHKTDFLFPYVGANPNTDFIDPSLELETDSSGYLIVNQNLETVVPGLYAIGDVTSRPIRQVVIAAGDGAIAAQQVIGYNDNN